MSPLYVLDVPGGYLRPLGSGLLIPLGYMPGAKPDATNTGVPAGTTLTPYHGDMVITTAGTVIDSADVFGFIDVRAANVVIRNTRVRGSSGGAGNTGLIVALNAACVNLRVDHCDLVPDFPSYWLDGILGDNFTATACDVYNVVDGFGINGTGVLNTALYSNWVHDLAYFSPDPNHSDNHTHNDCVQIFGGSGAIIAGNRLESFTSTTVGTLNNPATQGNSAIQLNQGTAPLTGLSVTDNWMDGGGVTLNGLGVSGNIGSILRNRFGHGSTFNQTIGLAAGVVCNTGDGTADQNVYDDTGLPVTVYHAP